jgi:DNA-binding CsgD family transcriptional regulator
MTPTLVGREAEDAQGVELLARVATGPAALVLQGEAGIGKSALWSAIADRAREGGFTVLAARPVETETAFSYAALSELLQGVLPDLTGWLPPIQRRALDVALLRTPPLTDETADPHVVAAAVAATVRALARERPVLIAVDDVPWLDPPTRRVLEFVVRRLDNLPVAVLLAARADSPTPAPLGLTEALVEGRISTVWLQPLSLGALHQLVHRRVGVTFPRPTLTRLRKASGGNPFYALEIARALKAAPPSVHASEEWLIPDSLRGLVAQRLAAAPAAATAVLLLSAAAANPTLELVGAALGDVEASRVGLEAAATAGLVTLDGDRVRFTHPLLASTLYAATGLGERRAAHARLAQAIGDSEGRARHLALATPGRDTALAAALEDAADVARRRGAPDAAAELLQLSRDRTPAEDREGSWRRDYLLAVALFEAGDAVQAETVLAELVDNVDPGRLRAEALLLRGTIQWFVGTAADAARHLDGALVDAAHDPGLAGLIHARLATFSDFNAPRAARHAQLAVEALGAEPSPPRGALALALCQLFYSEVMLGGKPRETLLEQAVAIERPEDFADASTIPGIWYCALDRLDEARDRFRGLLEQGRALGDASAEADLLTRLAEVELWADRWAECEAYADAAAEAAEQQGQPNADPARRIRALLDAHRGRLAEARATAVGALEGAEARNDPIIAVAYLAVLVFVTASEGNAAETEAFAARSAAHLETIGIVEPLRLDAAHERVEALVSLGQLDRAVDVLDRLEARHSRIPMPWLAAAITRGRAMVALARDDLPGALAATDGVEIGLPTSRPFDRARILLVRGQILRRMRARRAAADALRQALAIFEGLGAPVWAGRARSELDRLGTRRIHSDDLTPTEGQVAALAAEGLTNREVAARLFMSPKTVEAHLVRIYGKLAIASRAELGRVMANRASGVPDGTSDRT